MEKSKSTIFRIVIVKPHAFRVHVHCLARIREHSVCEWLNVLMFFLKVPISFETNESICAELNGKQLVVFSSL